jgi:hypothetical protein
MMSRPQRGLGQQAWCEPGLGAPADIEALKRRIVELEQELVGARDRHEQAGQQLAAARVRPRADDQLNAPTAAS